MAYTLQSTFSRGEIDPELADRPELELYRSALAWCENYITLKRGGIRRRGGTRYTGSVKTHADGAWLIPFEFGNGQYYMLELGDFYFRVYTSVGRVGTVEVTTPYSIDVVPTLKFCQSTDTLFFAGGGIKPQKLQRLSETSWTISEVEFKDGPYLPVNISSTTLTPGALGNPVPVMTANDAPSGTVTSAASTSSDYKMFNPDDSGTYLVGADDTGWLIYEFDSSKVIDAYALQAPQDNGSTDDMPAAWTVLGSNDGINWVILDTRKSETNWGSSEWRHFDFVNESPYTQYRINFSQGGGAGGDAIAINTVVYHERAENQTAFPLYASFATGINGDDGFSADDVGRHIRLLGSDGLWRWAKIASYSSATQVQIQLYGQSFLDQAAISSWRLGSWSEATGWPSVDGWHKDRLAFAGTNEEPQTVWESQNSDFNNFAVSQPLVASDAVQVGILSGQVNNIQWLSDDADLIVGTSKAVRVIGKAVDQEPFGADNIDQKPTTNFGSNSIQPVKIGEVLMYFDRYGTGLREMIYDFGSDGRLSQSVSEVQSHLFLNGISGACYQQLPSSMLWMWDVTGQGVGFTYEREQEVFGMQRQTFGDGVECMADLPGDGYDEVWMIVRREVEGETKRYIEILQKPFNGIAVEDAWHLDCALLYSGTAASTVTGLDHLEGLDVVMYADGADYLTTVVGGEVTLPNDLTAQKILVGVNVVAKAQTLSPPVNAQDGSPMGRKMQVNVAYASVKETTTLKIGRSMDNLDEFIRYEDGEEFNASVVPRTRRIPINTELRHEDHGQLWISASGGGPCTLLGLNGDVEVEP